MSKVGIPRGLFYYYYYPLWKTFFNKLGAQVITSSETNNKIIGEGINLAVDETCFPVKVYYGHVQELCKKDLDYIFIPRVVSVEPKSYICPKFMGIPDMIQATVKELPKVIDTIIDYSKTDKFIKKDIINVGRLFTSNKNLITQAYEEGLYQQKRFKKIASKGYTLSEAINIWESNNQISNFNDTDLNIGILGHGYSLYDNAVSMNIIGKLRELDCRVFLPEMLDSNEIEDEAATLSKRVFWTLGRKMVGSALHMDKRADIDGLIYVACFGCGPDSLIGEIIERKVNNIPFMLITIDEHTGEAGLITRLEAFCDMLRRRRQVINESNIPAHG